MLKRDVARLTGEVGRACHAPGAGALTITSLAEYFGRLGQGDAMPPFISLYEAKTHLSALVDRAAAGEEIVIAKNGIPCARLMPIRQRGEPRKPANIMRIAYIAADFDDPDPRIGQMFGNDPV